MFGEYGMIGAVAVRHVAEAHKYERGKLQRMKKIVGQHVVGCQRSNKAVILELVPLVNHN